MQTIVDHAAAVLAWTITILRFGSVLRERREGRGLRIRKSWLFILFMSLFITFELDGLYALIDSLAGINNLCWLLCWLFMTPALYFLCAIYCRTIPRWLTAYLWITEALLVLIFPFGPAAAPERANHVVPRNAGELVFTAVMYIYVISTASIIPLRVSIRALRAERRRHVRLRTIVTVLAMGAGIGFFVVKLAIFSYAFWVPSLPESRANSVTHVASMLAGAVAVLWPLSFASNRFYAILVRPSRFVEDILALRDLGALRARLRRLCSPTAPIPATWLDRLRNPDLFVYRDVIAILDGRKFLADRLGPAPEPSGGRPEGLAEPQALQEARRLYRAFQQVPLSLDFEDAVAAYRDVERRMRGTR